MLKSIAFMALPILFLSASGCSQEGQTGQAKKTIDLVQKARESKYGPRPISYCDARNYINGSKSPLLFSRGYVGSIELIGTVNTATHSVIGARGQRFEVKDRAKLATFYQDFDSITRSARRSIETKNLYQLAADFDGSIDLIKRWGASGIRQRYCERCGGGLRPDLDSLPAMVALRIFSLDGDEVRYKERIDLYLSTAERIENIKPPKTPSHVNIESVGDKIIDASVGDVSSQYDKNYALMIYYMMKGDERAAGEKWKLMSLGHFLTNGAPMADDEDRFLDDIRDPKKSPFDIVSIPRIDTKKYDACSGLYQNYLEYLVMLGTYDPHFKKDRGKISRRAREFKAVGDPLLFSASMTRMMDQLIAFERTERLDVL
jgi:hypothetical protein